MTRHRKFLAVMRHTPLRAGMALVCVGLMVLLAACGGGSPSTNNTSGSSVMTGGNDISGRTILLEIKSGASNFFFVPVVNGAKAAAAITGLKLQIQYGNDDDATIVNQMNTAIASNIHKARKKSWWNSFNTSEQITERV